MVLRLPAIFEPKFQKSNQQQVKGFDNFSLIDNAKIISTITLKKRSTCSFFH